VPFDQGLERLAQLVCIARELRGDLQRAETLEQIFESANRWRDELQNSKSS